MSVHRFLLLATAIANQRINLWTNVTITDRYHNNKGQSIQTVYGDQYEAIERNELVPGTAYCFVWSDVSVGSNADAVTGEYVDYYPYIRISFFKSSGSFVSRLLYQATNVGNGEYEFVVPVNAAKCAIEVDGSQSLRGQSFTNLRLYEVK